MATFEYVNESGRTVAVEKRQITFSQAVNWEYVHAHHTAGDGRIAVDSRFLDRIIESARSNGFAGKITRRGAATVANQNLY